MKRTAVLKRRATPRRTTSPRCSVQRCDRRANAGQWCKTHAERKADAMFSAYIRNRDGGCIAQTRSWLGAEFSCAGPLQCAHLISRRYHATRFDPLNAVALCAAHHRWLDTHPLEKDEQCREWVPGYKEWDDLRHAALYDPPADPVAVIAWLEGAA